MQPFLYVISLILSHVAMVQVLSINHIPGIKKEFFVKNIELEQLLADGIISREDIYKLPCYRRNRRCFADRIKRKGWKNQKAVNDVLNKGLNITNEGKFIEDVLKLMIADNADTLRGFNDEEVHISKALIDEQKRKTSIRRKKSKTRRKIQEDKSKNILRGRSFIPEVPDFLNTYNINEFNLELKPNDDEFLLLQKRRSNIKKYSPIQSARNTFSIPSNRYNIPITDVAQSREANLKLPFGIDDTTEHVQTRETILSNFPIPNSNTITRIYATPNKNFNQDRATLNNKGLRAVFQAENNMLYKLQQRNSNTKIFNNTLGAPHKKSLINLTLSDLEPEGTKETKTNNIENGNLEEMQNDTIPEVAIKSTIDYNVDTLDDSAVTYKGIEKSFFEIKKDIPMFRLRNSSTFIEHRNDEDTSDASDITPVEEMNKAYKKGTVFEQDSDFAITTDTLTPLFNLKKSTNSSLNQHDNNITNSKNSIQTNNNKTSNNSKETIENMSKKHSFGGEGKTLNATTTLIDNSTTSKTSSINVNGTRSQIEEEHENILPTSIDQENNSGNNLTVTSQDVLRDMSRTAQENLFRNRSAKYPIDSTSILKKLNINIKNSEKGNIDGTNDLTSFSVEDNQIKMLNKSENRDVVTETFNVTRQEKESNVKLLQKPENGDIVTAILNSTNSVGITEGQNISDSVHIDHDKKNVLIYLSNVTDKNNIDNKNNTNAISLLDKLESDRNISPINSSIEAITYISKNVSTDVALKRNLLMNDNKTLEEDLDSDFDFEDSFDNSLENVVTTSDSEIDDDNSGDTKNDIVIESNENYELENKHNKSRIFKLHLKDTASLANKNFQTVHWNFDDKFNWNDYINQYPFNVAPSFDENLMLPTSASGITIIGPTNLGNDGPIDMTPTDIMPPFQIDNVNTEELQPILTSSPPPLNPSILSLNIPPHAQKSHDESLANYIITTPSPTVPQSDPGLPTKNLTWAQDIPTGRIKAQRVCKPGSNKPFFPGKKSCLIVGDSIALSYSYSVATALRHDCQVQLAPLSKAGVALDSKYGLDCFDMFLTTKDLQPTYYDVIVFNFGLHDIDYLRRYPEEFNNITTYANNLKAIKKKVLATGATAAFVLSTPVSFDAEKDNMLKRYNHAAKRVMEEHPHVMTVNLHKLVTKECGRAPFDNCYMMKKPNDVHYGVTGSIMLGKRIAYTIKYLLRKRSVTKNEFVPMIMDFSENATQCNVETRCPVHTTCMNNLISRTGMGCCKLPHAVDCGDSWHCCPRGTVCHPACSDKSCSCIK